jgi:hypothetical protein
VAARIARAATSARRQVPESLRRLVDRGEQRPGLGRALRVLALVPVAFFGQVGRQFVDDMRELRDQMRRDRARTRRAAYRRLMRHGRNAQEAWERFVALRGAVPAGGLVALRFRGLYFRDVRRRRTDERLGEALGLPSALLFLGVPLVLLAPIHFGGAGRLLFWCGTLAGVVVIMVLLMRFSRPSLFVAAVATIPGAFAGASVTLRVRWHVGWPGFVRGQRLPDAAAGVVLLCGCVAAATALFLLTVLVVLAFESVRRARLTRREPDVVAFRALLRIADLLGGPERGFTELAKRRRLAGEVERLARVVEWGYPRAVAPPGPAERGAVTERYRQLARAIRTYQVSLALPDVDTLPALRRMATATTVAVCTGRLGSLVLPAPATTWTRRRLWRTATDAVRILVVALLPPVVAVLLWRYGVVRGTSGGTIVAVCALWGLVTVMTVLDPLFKDRVSIMKELLGMLFQGRKD